MFGREIRNMAMGYADERRQREHLEPALPNGEPAIGKVIFVNVDSCAQPYLVLTDALGGRLGRRRLLRRRARGVHHA